MLADRVKHIGESKTFTVQKRAKELAATGKYVIDFGLGEPDFPTADVIKEAGKRAIEQNKTRYTAAEGVIELRKALTEKLKREDGLIYTPEEIIVSNGAKHSLDNIMRILLDKGDKVLLPAPYWVSYIEQIKLAEGVPVIVHYDERITAELVRKNKDGIKAVILNYPNNPTGTTIAPEEVEEIAWLAVKHDFFVISDEVYKKFLYDEKKHISIARYAKDKTFVVDSVSKEFAMTGWRIGYVAGPREAVRAMANMQSHTTSNPSSVSQYAALEAMKENNQKHVQIMIQEYEKRRNLVQKALAECSFYLPEGTFFFFIKIPEGNSLEFCSQLLEQKYVATVPGEAFGADNYFRLSYCTSEDRLTEGIRRIKEFMG